MQENLELRPSTISNSGYAVFTTVTIGENGVIGYYYDTIAYDNISNGSSKMPSVYGQGYLEAPVKDFER